MIKDRRQEIVIIGSDLNKIAITEALDACLLKPEENENVTPGEDQVDLEDFKKNGWKFGWKTDEVCLPPWPDVQEALEGFFDEDEDDDEDSDENRSNSTPSR